MEIYTDGSVINSPVRSAAAAFCILENKINIIQKFRISPLADIMGAELFSILKALEYVQRNVRVSKGVVIYSDSLSSIKVLKNRKCHTYSEVVYNIQKLVVSLNSSFPVKIQYIPGHKNIKGNEMADSLAKEAHNNDQLNPIRLSKYIHQKQFERLTREMWQYRWKQEILNSGKGKFIEKIKNKLEFWPWSCHRNRRIEVALCRLRIGHAGLRQHLFRFKLSETNLCECGEPETIEHFFLNCILHQHQRELLKDELDQIKVPFNLKNLLGGGNYKENIQQLIINATAKYLQDTNKINDI